MPASFNETQKTNNIAVEERTHTPHSPAQEQPAFNKTENYDEGFEFDDDEISTKIEKH